MPQVFSRPAVLGVKLALLGLAILAAAVLCWQWAVERSFDPVGEAVAQPIPFSHKHHVGDDDLDCRFCHTTVETSAQAGLPSTRICMTCHSQLFTDAPLLAPLRDSAAKGTPIEWRRVHVLPDFVYFNHSVHVAKGVPCFECHGHIDQMPLTWRAHALEMQWCVNCHEDPSGRRVPHAQVFSMQQLPKTAETSAALPPLASRQRRTDCSTCHR